MSILIFSGYVHDVETKNINNSELFEVTAKHRMGYGEKAVTVFTNVSFWGQLGQIARDKISKNSRVHFTAEVKSGRPYMNKNNEPSFSMNCKGLGFNILAEGDTQSQSGNNWNESAPSAQGAGGGGWGAQQQRPQSGGWGGGGYENKTSGGGWGNQGGNDPVPF